MQDVSRLLSLSFGKNPCPSLTSFLTGNNDDHHHHTTTTNTPAAVHGNLDSSLALSGGKKGICFVLTDKHGNHDNNAEKVTKLNPHWNYSWSVHSWKDQPETIEFLHMIWGGAKTLKEMQTRIDTHIVPAIQAGSCKRLLCFNEPDKKEQSNMTVDRVLEFWPILEALNIPLCSPSCANPLGCTKADDSCQGVQGTWMKEFTTKLDKRGYRCDYIGVHWYGNPNAAEFKKRMKDIFEAYGSKRPLLITEFAVADWQAMRKSPKDNRHTRKAVLDFMKKVLPWMEQQDWIAGYAWFPFAHDSAQGTCSALFDAKGKLTALGRYYKSVSASKPWGNQEAE